MANNYCQFSAMIENLSPEACEWVKTVLTLDFEDDYDEIKAMLSLEGGGVDLENWPDFCFRIEDNGVGADVQHDLWLYSEECFDAEHLSVFVRELICRFMPDYIFAMTSAETCSKPRVGEFGGGWMVITKDTVQGGNTWDAARECVATIEKGRRIMENES